MTEPRGSLSLHLLSRRRRRRPTSSSLEEPLLGNDEESGDDVEEAEEQSCSLLFTDTRRPSRPPGHHHRRIDAHFIHPALEYEIPSSSELLLEDINHNNNNNICFNNSHDCLLHQQQHQEEDCPTSSPRTRQSKSKSIKLFFSFILLILFGSANSVALKLQAIPMYNYPNFLILFVNFMYIPICFAYILPASHFGWFNQAIPAVEHWNISFHRPFIIMGFLDGIASCMQILSAVYLPGPLVVLLPQAAIPMSMFLSKWLLHERFHHYQVMGAVVVVLGILLVLEPVVTQRLAPDYYCQALNMENADDSCSICKVENTQNSCLSHLFFDDNDDALTVLQQQWHRESTTSTGTSDESNNKNSTFNNNLLCDWVPFEEATRQEEFLMFVWSLVLIASCIPLTLSTVYKQMALGNYDNINNDNNNNNNIRQQPPLDPIFLNGWISVYQFIFSLPLAIPIGLVSSPPVPPAELLHNLWNGLRCYALGMSFITTGCHVDDLCSSSSTTTNITTTALHYFGGGGSATFYVNLSLVINVGYTIAMILVVKYGSTALLFLALTVMVPISHLTFSLPFLPLATTTLHVSDIVGLIVIMAGIILYRFCDGMAACSSFCKDNNNDDDNIENDVVDDVDDAANNSCAASANSEQATVGVVDDGGLLENGQNTNIGQEVGEGKEDPLLILIQPLRRTLKRWV